MPRAVIFDLDGTLLDTLRDLADATNAVLRRRGMPEHPVDDYRLLVGEGMDRLVVRALPPVSRDPATVAAALAELRREYAGSWRLHTRPYPGIPAVLEALGARGVPAAVLSNKVDEFTREMVQQYFGSRFAVVRGARAGVPLKPDPTAALAVAASLRVAPRDVMLVGDTRVDMDTARAAGMVPVGVLWGFRDEEELRAHGAAHLAREPGDLLGLV